MDEQSAEDAAERFWREIVPQHRASLTDLTVRPIYRGPWCYGAPAASAIQQCVSLQRLSLQVCELETHWAADKIAQLQEDDEIQLPVIKDSHGNIEHCSVCVSFSPFRVPFC